MAAEGGHIDFIFLVLPRTRPLDPLLQRVFSVYGQLFKMLTVYGASTLPDNETDTQTDKITHNPMGISFGIDVGKCEHTITEI